MLMIRVFSVVENVREVYLPMLWFGVSADLTDNLLFWIHFTLIGPYIGSASFFVAFVVCLVFVARSGVKYSAARKNENKTDDGPPEPRSSDASLHL